jgi:succinate dehydrogenase / fumarate reductase, membrane anchor subunit
MRSVGGSRPESGLELYGWLFMRVSGIILLFLAIGHLVIMHLINNVEVIDYTFVAARYTTPFWKTYDLAMLWLALLHGLNGARTIIDDYVLKSGWRIAALACLALVALVFLALGSLVMLAFRPVRSV